VTRVAPADHFRRRSARSTLAVGVPIASLLVLLGAGCGSHTSSGSEWTVGSSAPTTGLPSAPSTAADLTTPPDAAGFTVVPGEPYLVVDGIALGMDAYVPVGAGPWPILVTFHGNSADGKDTRSNTIIAEEAARRGMLVVAPTWIAGDPFPLGVDDIVALRHAGNCATAAAQDWAAELGGDVSETVVHGFSAGTGPALAATVAPMDGVPGCRTPAAPASVAGAVLGDGEFFYHSAPFDGAFAEDLGAMQREVAALSDPRRWPADLGARVYVWAAEAGTAPRPVADPDGDAFAWLPSRDPDGTIRADLDDLGALDDGIVDYLDAARFIDRRLGGAGVDVEFQVYPGGHSVADKVDEVVTAILGAGGR